MKKRSKILASLLLALVMVFTLTSTAFAANVIAPSGHTYEAYQIFSGTQAADSTALGDVKWGTGIKSETTDNSTSFLNALKSDDRFVKNGDNIFSTCSTAADVAAVLSGYENKSDIANAFANVAAKYLTTQSTTVEGNTVLSEGYYLLVDTTTIGSDVNDARNSALLQVTNKGSIKIEKKYDVPTVDKGIVKGNELVEADDVNIGDDVTFRLTGTLPSNYADYETYKYVFHDTLSAGLKYNGDAKVYVVNGETKTEINTGFTIDPSTAATAGGGTLTITFANLKNITSVSAASKIVVEYTAELTTAAEIGQPGNKNEVYLEYSNDPNQTGSGEPTTSNTPKDEVLVFTYELDVTKIDGQDPDKKLAGAEFKLKNADNKWVTVDPTGKVTGWSDTEEGGTTLTSDANGFFKIVGLDAGTYSLKETKAPAGYNLLENPIAIVISAELDTSETNPALTALTIKVDNGEAKNGNLDTGVVATDVENNKGATLPETGGIGTTIFYALGGALAVGAAVLLITKKRMNAEK